MMGRGKARLALGSGSTRPQDIDLNVFAAWKHGDESGESSGKAGRTDK